MMSFVFKPILKREKKDQTLGVGSGRLDQHFKVDVQKTDETKFEIHGGKGRVPEKSF